MPQLHDRFHQLTAGSTLGAMLVAACLGCSNMNNTQKGAALGAAGGAGLGAIVGNQLGSSGAGALIGGLAGTAVGALAGNAKDEADQKEAYAQQAAYERRERIREQRAMTNQDVVDMHANGVADSVIMSTMQDRGGNFNTSPSAIIALTRNGVSERVIQSMQYYNQRR